MTKYFIQAYSHNVRVQILKSNNKRIDRDLHLLKDYTECDTIEVASESGTTTYKLINGEWEKC